MSRAALLAAVLDDPDNDDLRLVLADWLEEHGEAERAELVRVQIELARAGTGNERFGFLQTRERQLLAPHAGKWFDYLDVANRFRRGFLDGIRCDGPAHFLAVADRLFASQPVRCLRFYSAAAWDPAATVELAACPHLARIRRLGLPRWERPDEPLLALTASPHLAGLRTLDLGGYDEHDRRIGDDLFAELVGRGHRPPPPCLAGLRALRVGWAGLGDDTLHNLLASPCAEALTALDLESNEFTAAGVAALVGSPAWGRLTDLALSGVGFGDPATGPLLVGALGRSGIRRLFVDLNGAELAAAESWGPLEALRLTTTDETAGAHAVAASPHLGRLQRLELYNDTGVTDEVLRALAANPHAGRLEHLEFYLEAFGDEGVAVLAESPHLTALRHLTLDSTKLTAAGLGRLLRSGLARRLRWLDVSGTDVGDEGVRLLAETAPLPNLTTLGLRLTGAPSPEALWALLASPLLPRLSYLSVYTQGRPHEYRRLLLQARHVAWPGVPQRDADPGDLAALYAERFGAFDGSKHLPWEEPLFPVFD
jgi:uncharacterized protein (TIGR02996 family)